MPRYLVERTGSGPLGLLELARDAGARLAFVATNAGDGVTWLHSSVAPDGRRSFCLYDAPDPAAIRLAARRHGLPVDRITEVEMIAP
jgi:hypothetical protein